MAQSRTESQLIRLRDINQSPASGMLSAAVMGRKTSTGGIPSPPHQPSLPPQSASASALSQQHQGSYNTNELKIAVLGFNGVGKTAFIVRFLTRRFIGEYCRGIEAKYKCSISVDGEIIRLEILDSSLPTLIGDRCDRKGASSVYFRLNENTVEWADAFILVYSITSHRSFQVIREMRKQICEQYASMDRIHEKPVMMLLGNKADLEHFREIDSKTAEAYADQKNDLVFYELSTANSPDDVQRCMYAFIRLARVRLLTSVAAASIVHHQQHEHEQHQQQQHQIQQHQQHQQQQQQQQQKQQQQLKQMTPPIEAAQAATMSHVARDAAAVASASDGGKQSAKAFLLNKMFGGMMKQAKQASGLTTGFTAASGSRRSGDSGSGLVIASSQTQGFSD